MKKKLPVLPVSKAKSVAQCDDRAWHNGGDIEIGLYARSIHQAARKMIATLDLEPNARMAWDACPVVLLYREAIELQLKFLVGEGCNFLRSPTDPITLYKTHSLRWLAQIVCQIVKKVRWENEFKCEGVASLSDFSALINELEMLDPIELAVNSSSRRVNGSLPHQLEPSNVVRFANKLDGLFELLNVTADTLAATWDQQVAGERTFHISDHIKPTIH